MPMSGLINLLFCSERLELKVKKLDKTQGKSEVLAFKLFCREELEAPFKICTLQR